MLLARDGAGGKMADGDRLRVPIDDLYLIALGRALYCFSSLEWMAVYCIQKIAEQGHNPAVTRHYVETVAAKTAGQIARDFKDAADGIIYPALKLAVQPAADRFRALVQRRNDLMHANPGIALSGDQRLFRKGAEWTIPAIEDLSDKFTECSLTLNDLYYKVI